MNEQLDLFGSTNTDMEELAQEKEKQKILLKL